MPKENVDLNLVNSIIGPGSAFRGEFKVDGVLRIDGRFKGIIETNGNVLIGQPGKVYTDIKANSITIGGFVKGNIYAVEKVTLLSNCYIIGDITTPRLILEEGVNLDGSCIINPGKSKKKIPDTLLKDFERDFEDENK